MASPIPTGPSTTRLCPLCPQEPWWVTAYCPPWESTGVLGWWDTAATCLLVPFCPVARARLVLLPHNAPSSVPGSCRSTGELSLPRGRPACSSFLSCWKPCPILLSPRAHTVAGSSLLVPHGGCGWCITTLSSAGARAAYCTTSQLRALLGFPESSHC